MFLQFLTPQNTPHDCIHAPQMYLKMHPDWKNRPCCCILAHPSKCIDLINMHTNYGETSLYLPLFVFWPHTHTSRIHHHQWSRNRYWEWPPNGHLMNTSWDATELRSPRIHLLSRYDYLPTSDPLVQVNKIEVGVEAKEYLMDWFINDIVALTIDESTWVERAKNAALEVIHTILRPLQNSEPLNWYEPLSLHKLEGEGHLVELKTCLGWYIQIHSL